MTLRIDWMVLSEAAAHDSRGALTLIGVERNLAIVSSLPSQRKYAVAASIREDDSGTAVLVQGVTLSVEVTVISPSGATVLATRSASTLGERSRPELPTGASAVFDVNLNLEEYGEYRIVCAVSADGLNQEARAERSVYVVEPKAKTP